MHRQVHLAQTHRLGHALHAINADHVLRTGAVPLSKISALHKHAPRAASRIVDLALKRLDDLHNQFHQCRRRKEFPAALALAHCKFTQKIFVDLAEGIAFHLHRHRIEILQQIKKHLIAQPIIGLGKHIFQIRIFRFDRPHRIVDRLPNIGGFRHLHQRRPARFIGQKHDPLRLIIQLRDAPSPKCGGLLPRSKHRLRL